jgi:Fe-S-cluster containining protein
MYKVDPKNEIARFRTPEQAGLDDAAAGGFIGADLKDEAKIQKLVDRIIAEFERGKSFMLLISMAHKLADLLSTNSAKHSVCQRGCSHCCKILVGASLMESTYISRKTGTPLIEDRTYDLKHDDKSISYCPFHDPETASCGIYENRPIACRIFFAFDSPEYCVGGDQVHAISTDNGKAPVKILQDICMWLIQASGNKAGDLRGYFDAVDFSGNTKKKAKNKK